jgi:hypothetical protein
MLFFLIKGFVGAGWFAPQLSFPFIDIWIGMLHATSSKTEKIKLNQIPRQISYYFQIYIYIYIYIYTYSIKLSCNL